MTVPLSADAPVPGYIRKSSGDFHRKHVNHNPDPLRRTGQTGAAEADRTVHPDAEPFSIPPSHDRFSQWQGEFHIVHPLQDVSMVPADRDIFHAEMPGSPETAGIHPTGTPDEEGYANGVPEPVQNSHPPWSNRRRWHKHLCRNGFHRKRNCHRQNLFPCGRFPCAWRNVCRTDTRRAFPADNLKRFRAGIQRERLQEIGGMCENHANPGKHCGKSCHINCRRV